MNQELPYLRMACPGCRKNLKIRADRVGQKLKCPGCGTSVVTSRPKNGAAIRTGNSIAAPGSPVVPAVPPPVSPAAAPDHRFPYGMDLATPAASPEEQLEALLRRFSGDFPRPGLSPWYLITALFVCLVLLILPVLYFALIAGIGWLTYWHALHDWTWMTHLRGRAAIYVALIYGGLIVAGVIWVLSLLKPVFRGWGRSDASEGISREDHPLLYLFAERLADIVGSPRPTKIQLSPRVNASASYSTRMFGLMRTDFCLTLGVPLIAGMTLPQLAGVIAHEFGHFSQRRGCFLGRLIDRVNSWILESVYRRDWIDDFVEGAHESENFVISMLGLTTWCALNAGRGILLGLGWFGVAVSGTLSRQMEYDADQYACGVTGSESFAGALERLMELVVAENVAADYIFSSQDGCYLPNDYAGFLCALADQHKKIKKKARKTIDQEKANWLVTHPPIRNRIAAARQLGWSGIFDSRLLGKKLLRHFNDESQKLTLVLYCFRFGPHFQVETLRPTSEAIERYLAVFK